jgi:putative membrane protein
VGHAKPAHLLVRAVPGAGVDFWREPAAALSLSALAAAVAGIVIPHFLELGALSRHMAQHIVLMNVLAPLCAIVIDRGLSVALPVNMDGSTALWLSTGLQIAGLWAWHAPAAQALAVKSAPVAAVMHLTMFAAALAFWTALLRLREHDRWQGMLALLATGKLACLLAALLVLTPRVLYPVGHGSGHGTAMVTLQDQQLAGLLMIAACPLSYVLAGVVLAAQMVVGFSASRSGDAAGNGAGPG